MFDDPQKELKRLEEELLQNEQIDEVFGAVIFIAQS